jgi:secondary thiamine-phosphate synthase enzyme
MIQRQLQVVTRGRGCHELTSEVNAALAEEAVTAGLCHLFIRHTSASLMLCENADPTVLADLEAFMGRLAPDGDPRFRHAAEGPDDMPAHVRSVLTHSSLTIPVHSGRLALGTWQGVFLWEHRTQGHRRHILMTIQGARD